MSTKSKRTAANSDLGLTDAPPKKTMRPRDDGTHGKPPATAERTGFQGKPSSKKGAFRNPPEKTDWTTFKKKKKELKTKRKQSKDLYDVVVQAKPIAELLRKKRLPGGKEEREKLISKLHELFNGKGQYSKLVFTHDMSRVVQYMLKFGPEMVREAISKELIPASAEMIASKYGRYCLKSMLKHGNNNVRSESIKAMYGQVVKLVSHTVSAGVFEHVYSNWATAQQKRHLIQEFYGNMYKQCKDDRIKHLGDVFRQDPTMKTATLGAVKDNLSKVLNKDLLDSGLVQSALCEYFKECNTEDKCELIEQLANHAVVLSNSKDGVQVVMQCIWHGGSKTKKVIMKTLKEHVVELSKHEHGHWSVITALDAIDDTVLINKMLIAPVLTEAEVLAANEWGRKVLLWLVAPGSSAHFHPQFVNTLEVGRSTSTCKKSPETRRQELLEFASGKLLETIASWAEFWLSSASVAMVTLAVLKTASDNDNVVVQEVLEKIAEVVVGLDWKINDKGNDVPGIEHPGLHMVLKKLLLHTRADSVAFAQILLDALPEETMKQWLTSNRGCFLLTAVFESSSESAKKQLRQKLHACLDSLEAQDSKGAQVLLQKLI